MKMVNNNNILRD